MPGTLTIGGMSAGLAGGESLIGPVTTTGLNTVGARLPLSLAVGDNVFAVPSGATSVAIFLGTASTATITVRTNLNASDAGLPIAPMSGIPWAKVDLVTGVTEVILHSSATLTDGEVVFI